MHKQHQRRLVDSCGQEKKELLEDHQLDFAARLARTFHRFFFRVAVLIYQELPLTVRRRNHAPQGVLVHIHKLSPPNSFLEIAEHKIHYLVEVVGERRILVVHLGVSCQNIQTFEFALR